MKALAVIVTHNRSDLLYRCIKAVMAQSFQLDEILVIDNGSTDGTGALLDRLNVTAIHQENVGSAGGWHAGLSFALENNFDYCWLMDDDGYPSQNAFELLSTHFQQPFSCLSSVVLIENDHSKLVFPMPKLNKYGHPRISLFRRKMMTVSSLPTHQLIYPFAHLFNGALVSMEAVKKIGNINKDYFIMGDEVDYFYRLREFGPVGTLLKAIHYHPDVTDRPYSKMKIYYLIKNTIINNSKYMNFVVLRNLAAVLIILKRLTQRNGLKFSLRLLFNKNFFLLNAIKSGLKAKLGKDF
jgi:rhamnopyranosyl-N-acetylglucosaminyl-diphospho-decaprenol beta-1,3/1,4-galactofuranosyltransferase